MTDYARSMLSELMAPFEPSKHKFYDKEVCKHFLVKFCPNSLFTNTKSDLGNCDLVHDEKLREAYQNDPEKDTYPYEDEFYDYLTYLHNDLDRKIRRGKERKDKEVDEVLLNPKNDEKEEKIVILEQKIKEALQKVEEAGEEGRVDEAQVLTDQVEGMQKELQELQKNDEVNPIFRQENKMEVCHVCGAFLVMNDTSNRLDAHLQGKQHTGYQKIQETYEEMRKQRGDRPSGGRGGGGRDHYSDRSDRSGRDRGYGDSRRHGGGSSRDHYHRDDPYRRDGGGRDRRDYRDRSRDRNSGSGGGRRDYDRRGSGSGGGGGGRDYRDRDYRGGGGGRDYDDRRY